MGPESHPGIVPGRAPGLQHLLPPVLPLPMQTRAALSPQSPDPGVLSHWLHWITDEPHHVGHGCAHQLSVTTKDLRDKKDVVWGVGVGRDVPASGDTNEKSGEQEATSEVGQEGEGEGEREEDGDEDEEVEVDLGQRAAEDVEGDDVDTWKRRPMRMTGQQNGKINLF